MILFSMWDTFITMLVIMCCFAAGYLGFYLTDKIYNCDKKTRRDIVTYLISAVAFAFIIFVSVINNDWHKTNTGFYSETFFIGVTVMMIILTNLRINSLRDKVK